MKLFLSETLTCTQTTWTKSGNGSTKSSKSKNLSPTLNLQSYLQIKSSKFEKSWFRKSRTLIWKWRDKGKRTCEEAETLKGDFIDQANHHTTPDGIMKPITSSQDQPEIGPIKPAPIHLGPSSEKISSETHAHPTFLISFFHIFITIFDILISFSIYFLWLCFDKKVYKIRLILISFDLWKVPFCWKLHTQNIIAQKDMVLWLRQSVCYFLGIFDLSDIQISCIIIFLHGLLIEAFPTSSIDFEEA